MSRSDEFSQDILASELSAPHINNQIEFAHIFLKVAQREYGSGNARAGQEAETRVKIALAEAKRWLSELPTPKQSVFSAKLDALHLALDTLVKSTDHDLKGIRPC